MARPTPTIAEREGRFLSSPHPIPTRSHLPMLEGARSVGIPTFENQNGRMMEGDGGASILDLVQLATDTANPCSVLTFSRTWTGQT